MNESVQQPPAKTGAEPVRTDPSNGTDRAWPDEAKILPEQYLKQPAAEQAR